jgi:hypothetical protein
MSQLVALQRDLQDVSAAIAHAERTLAAHPFVPSVEATLRTIQNRRENLEEQFFAVANEMGLDVCSYRIEPYEYQRITIAGMTAVLGAFQKVFTSVYDAVVNGRPKKSAKASAAIIDATTFGFAYTFPGSTGVMMTLENERLLLTETDLDAAMKKTFELMSYRDQSQIEEITKQVGLGAVRQAYQWANENAIAGYGAAIVWQREGISKFDVRIQTQEIARLASVIRGATAKEEVTLIGDLLDVSIPDKTFQMYVDGKMIQGGFDVAISHVHPVQLPKRYRATMNVQEKVVTEEGKDEITYFLLRLEPTEASPLLPDLESR